MKRSQVILFLLTIVSALGCRPEKPIEVKEYEKPSDIMMVGMMTRSERAWTLKAVDQRQNILAIEDSVYEFAKSLDFGADPANPTWKLPEGWQKLDIDKPFRKATFMASGAEGRVEVVLSELTLGKRARDPLEFIAENINRWRGQMGLDKITNYTSRDGRDLSLGIANFVIPYMKRVTVGSGVMYFQKIEGKRDNSSAPPFAKGMGGMPTSSGTSEPSSKQEPGGDDSGGDDSGDDDSEKGKNETGKSNAKPAEPELPFTYTAPESWKKIAGNSVAVLRFQVGDEKENAIIAVSRFRQGMVSWDATTSMWQNNLNAEKKSADELNQATKEIGNDTFTGKMLELSREGKPADDPSKSENSDNEAKGLIGVMIPRSDADWFVRYEGNQAVVEKTKPEFLDFIRSFQFPSESNE